MPISGHPGVTHAFVPDALPPNWVWPEALWPVLLKARTSLASLDGTGRQLPNPGLILTPLRNREADRSSTIEGTITDPQQQALFNIEPRYPTSPTDPANAAREVFNYGEALRLREHSQLPLSLRLIRELHAVLMDGVRGSDQRPGEFRRLQNQVGKPPRYVPPPVDVLATQLDDFERYLHATNGLDPLVRAFLCHYQFEAIHPFADGNGRVGRLLLALCIAEWCDLSDQWLYMSAYFDRNRDRYIDLMFRVSTHGDWTSWIDFCLRGVVETADDTLKRCERLLDLSKTYREKLTAIGGSMRLSAIVDDLFFTPVAVVTRVQRRFEVSYPTASSDLKKLAEAGILVRFESVSQISYYCADILAITYDDPA
ncbi:Fic family protein [Myxococcota bacterium]|nr:Fic family protein [Myxococcota bacterium]